MTMDTKREDPKLSFKVAIAALHYDIASPFVKRARLMLRRRRPLRHQTAGTALCEEQALKEAAMALARLWNARAPTFNSNKQ
jgi:hypothetical protein